MYTDNDFSPITQLEKKVKLLRFCVESKVLRFSFDVCCLGCLVPMVMGNL